MEYYIDEALVITDVETVLILEWRANQHGFAGDLCVGGKRVGEVCRPRTMRAKRPWRAWVLADYGEKLVGWFASHDEARVATEAAAHRHKHGARAGASPTTHATHGFAELRVAA